MAYSDYGAFVYLNGKRRTLTSDERRLLEPNGRRHCIKHPQTDGE